MHLNSQNNQLPGGDHSVRWQNNERTPLLTIDIAYHCHRPQHPNSSWLFQPPPAISTIPEVIAKRIAASMFNPLLFSIQSSLSFEQTYLIQFKVNSEYIRVDGEPPSEFSQSLFQHLSCPQWLWIISRLAFTIRSNAYLPLLPVNCHRCSSFKIIPPSENHWLAFIIRLPRSWNGLNGV